MPMRSPLLLLLAALFTLTACDSTEDDRIVAGVDLDVLFAPPTSNERAALLAAWQARDVSVQHLTGVAMDTVSSGGRAFDAYVVSHTVAGVKHYGAVLLPRGVTGPLPVVVYAHGGDGGVRVEEAAALAGLLSPQGRDFIWVVPSFRAEPLRFRQATYLSEGPASPWDYDVDDALALLNAAASLDLFRQPDYSRVGVVGISRGGGVGLLMAVREARIKHVIDLFGPTDFFGPYVQEIVVGALRGQDRNLPGFDVLNSRFVQPLRAGDLSTDEMRLELLRRSPVYFADRLPAVQVQHGTADDVVDVSQSRRLAEALQGRSDFAYFEWAGGTHNPASFPINWLFEVQTALGAL